MKLKIGQKVLIMDDPIIIYKGIVIEPMSFVPKTCLIQIDNQTAYFHIKHIVPNNKFFRKLYRVNE